MLETLRSGKSMSVLLQSQDADSNLLGHHSESSSSRSILSTQSPRSWYHRTLDRFISQPGSPRQSSGLQGSASINKLSKKTSQPLLNTNINYRHVFSTQRRKFDERNASLVQLPGTPGGQTCRPISLIVHERTVSSLDLLTPDQSGLSSDSGGPVTPHATESVYSLPIFAKGSRDYIMGHSDSKVASAKVSKIIRKPVSGLLRGKKSQQTEVNEDTPIPPHATEPVSDPQPASGPAPETASEPAPGPAPELTAESGPGSGLQPIPEPAPIAEAILEHTEAQPQDPEKVDSGPTAPPPDLRHRASSGKLKVPRRRSSLTAIHLDRSHFETPLTLKHSGSSTRGTRTTSFSEGFRPIVTLSGSTTAVSSPNPQEDDGPGDPQSPDLLSPPRSQRRPSDAGSSSSQTRPAHIWFPATFPNGAPPLKPARLKESHFKCYHSHKLMMRERPMFNQVPCMACGIDDRRARFTCQWCELRLCDSCMRQLHSIPGRPLEPVLEWVADKVKAYIAHGAATYLKKRESKETIKQQKSTETLPASGKIGQSDSRKVGRSSSIAPSVDTIKEKRTKDHPESKSDSMKDTLDVDHNAGEDNQSPIERIKIGQSSAIKEE